MLRGLHQKSRGIPHPVYISGKYYMIIASKTRYIYIVLFLLFSRAVGGSYYHRKQMCNHGLSILFSGNFYIHFDMLCVHELY